MRLRIAFRQTAAITHDSIWQGHVLGLARLVFKFLGQARLAFRAHYFTFLGLVVEHSNSRFESIRFVMQIDSFSKIIGLSIH